MHCIGCDYSLRGLESDHCPECGRTFDLNNPRTYRPLPAEQRRQLAINDARSNIFSIVSCAAIALLFAVIDLIFTNLVLIQFIGCFGFLALFGFLISLVRVIRILRGWLPDRKY